MRIVQFPSAYRQVALDLATRIATSFLDSLGAQTMESITTHISGR